MNEKIFVSHLKIIAVLCIVFNVNFLIAQSEVSYSIPSEPLEDNYGNYTAIIEECKIETNTLQKPDLDALIQGNGDLHSLLYAKGDQLILRLAKNDVYDARIDTSEDLELAKIDIATGETSRELTLPPSWNKPYPLSINFANLLFDYSGKQNASIDILRSNANINEGEIVIRPLLQDNVYYIQTAQKLELEGQPWKPIPKAEIGKTEDGIRWVLQDLPPDATGDWKGMQVVTALATKGKHHYLSVVTSLEEKNPMQSAIALAKSYLNKETKLVIKNHENLWMEFWKKSGVRLSDKDLNKSWYQNLYFSRCAQNPKAQAIGLFIGPLLKPLEGWHDNYTINYNFQQTFWSFLNTNHVEYIDPYNKVVLEYLTRAKWFAKETYNIDGAFYPHNIYRHEPINPEESKSNNHRMFAGAPWAYTLGLSSFLMHNLWNSYKYHPDSKKLKKIYPAIRELTRFYVNFSEQCKIDENGKLQLGPTISPEHMPFGVYNCPFDIAFIKFSFRGFLEASEKLNIDKELAVEVKKYLEMMPEYPVQKSTGILVDRENGSPLEYNIPVPTTPIFPAEQITFFSPTNEKKLFAKTLQAIETNGNNSTIMLAVSKARLSTLDAKAWLKKQIGYRQKPNGSLNLSEKNAAFNAYGHYTEMFSVSGAISELLLQSVDDIIRIFPAWPLDEDAEYTTLRTQGGFLVSAKLKNKTIEKFEILSEFGEDLNIYSPWEKIYLNGKELKKDSKGVVYVKSEKGKFYFFSTQKK